MKNKKSGWVIKDIETGKFVSRSTRYEFARKLKNAVVFPNREIARLSRFVGTETVQRVKTSKDGIAKKVTAGNGPNCKL